MKILQNNHCTKHQSHSNFFPSAWISFSCSFKIFLVFNLLEQTTQTNCQKQVMVFTNIDLIYDLRLNCNSFLLGALNEDKVKCITKPFIKKSSIIMVNSIRTAALIWFMKKEYELIWTISSEDLTVGENRTTQKRN